MSHVTHAYDVTTRRASRTYVMVSNVSSTQYIMELFGENEGFPTR